jgi:hypothetical protein
MKNKYFTLLSGCFFLLGMFCFSGNLLSQELSLDETVTYINDKINENNNYKTIFQITKYGSTTITFISEGNTGKQIVKFNFNDIEEITYVNDDEDYYYCVRLLCASGNCIRSDSFGDGRYFTGLAFWSFCNNTETDAKALVKAFIYLKSLIKTDPFQ